jgi:hypothetical protein
MKVTVFWSMMLYCLVIFTGVLEESAGFIFMAVKEE